VRPREGAGVLKGDGLLGLLLILILTHFKGKKNRVTHLLNEAKSSFLAEFIDQNADSYGKLFRAVKDLLVEKNTLCFSDYTDKSALANDL